MDGFFSANDSAGKIQIHPVLLETMAIRVFEQILYQAYVTATGDFYNCMPLIHSSGVIRNGKGFLFVGASEAGKSTVAGFSSAFQVINDEITIADVSGKYSHPAVHAGLTVTTGRKRQAVLPLPGSFILNKDKKHAVKSAAGGTAIKLIASQIIPPAGLNHYMQNSDYLRQVDIALELSRKIPLYNLRFAKNAGFWDEIENVTG